jgi:hypothetical protein
MEIRGYRIGIPHGMPGMAAAMFAHPSRDAAWDFGYFGPEGIQISMAPDFNPGSGIPCPVASRRDRMTSSAPEGHSIPPGWASRGDPETPN